MIVRKGKLDKLKEDSKKIQELMSISEEFKGVDVTMTTSQYIDQDEGREIVDL